jgi:hypothetical protein
LTPEPFPARPARAASDRPASALPPPRPGGGAGDTSSESPEPLWWPPAKIVGRYLGPFLASFAGVESPPETASATDAVRVDSELGGADVGMPRALLDVREGEPTALEAMSSDPVLVAPEERTRWPRSPRSSASVTAAPRSSSNRGDWSAS